MATEANPIDHKTAMDAVMDGINTPLAREARMVGRYVDSHVVSLLNQLPLELQRVYHSYGTMDLHIHVNEKYCTGRNMCFLCGAPWESL